MSKLKLNIITPERTLFSEEVLQVTLFTKQGEITVLPGHIPVISTLASGELRYVKDNKTTPIIIHGGFAEILDYEVNVLADAAEKIEEIEEERALEAKKNAEEMLSFSRKNTPGILSCQHYLVFENRSLLLLLHGFWSQYWSSVRNTLPIFS